MTYHTNHPCTATPAPPNDVERIAAAWTTVRDNYLAAGRLIAEGARAYAARLRLEAAWGPRRTADARPWTPPTLLVDDAAPARHSSVAGLASFSGAR